MTAEALREHLHAAPFVPFTVHLADGRGFFVDHPDFAKVLRDDRHVFINFEGARHVFVHLRAITRVEFNVEEAA